MARERKGEDRGALNPLGGAQRPTMQDVARRAGVSASTVSRFFNGARVHQHEAVEKAIRELGYQMSTSGRSLRTGRQYAVAILGPGASNPFFSAALEGAERVARRVGYVVLLYELGEDSNAAVSDLAGRVDGVLLTPPNEQDTTAQRLRDAGVPVVLLDGLSVGSDDMDAVLVDHYQGGRRAVEHLVDLGHERIGGIHGPVGGATAGRERHAGFRDALLDKGLGLPEEYDLRGAYDSEAGRSQMLRLMALREPPTAVVSGGNLITVGALKAIRELELAVPEEVSLIGADDFPTFDVVSPAVTVVDRPMAEQGARAMDTMLERLGSGAGGAPTHIKFGTKLIVRGSTGRPRN